ncbi:hypothetical protein DV737_g5027, partial [Chaetothyriales sp. CBS 132003]
MADSLLSTGFSYIGWAFLPSVLAPRPYATSLLQGFYYRLVLPAGTPPPQPSTPQFAAHHRRIRVLVLTLYLVYTLVQSLYDIKLAGDFYTVLAVTPTSSDREIKARFRRLAAKYHPDKVSSSTSSAAAAEDIFVHLKLASDTLLNPSLRFAYDRFGPVITTVTRPQLKTIRDYVYAGLRAKAPYYASNALLLVVLNATVLPRWGRFWRYFAVAVLAVLELCLLTHDQQHLFFSSFSSYVTSLAHSTFPNLLPPHLLPYQILIIAQRLSMSLNIFISQLAPQAGRQGLGNSRSTELQHQNQQQALHLTHTASRLDAEASQMLQLGLTPFKGDATKTRMLREEMKQGLMMGVIRNNEEVRAAVRTVLDRRRRESERT